MRVALTGANGFLGNELLRQMKVRADMEVYAFTSRRDVLQEKYFDMEDLIVVDNSEASHFDFSRIDVLLNCAFPRNVEDASFASGLDFIQRLLMQAVGTGVGAVINISSQSVYSQKRLEPADENAPIVLESKYAVGKYATELLTNALCRDIPHTNIRLASLIGAGFDQRITNKFAKKIAAGEGITITGGKQQFGFMDVRDAAAGLICLMESDSSKWQEVYNLGTCEGYTLQDIALRVQEIGKEFSCYAPEVTVNEDDTWQNSVLNCQRFQNTFEWVPAITLDQSIRDIFRMQILSGR